MEKFFNKLEFNKIINIMDCNPIEAKERFIKYLDDYPKDYVAWLFYSSLLICIGNIDEADIIIKKLEVLIRKDNFYRNQPQKLLKLRENFLFTKLKLLMYQNKYEEAYDFFQHNLIEKTNKQFTIYLYLVKKIGLDSYSEVYDYYLTNQIVNYSEDEFIKHVEKHLADYNVNLDERNDNLFISDFNVKKIVEEIKKYIPSNKRLFGGFYEDYYYFKYDECGREKNRLVDYFKVICFHDTNEFITMLPISYGANLPYIDLNYLKEKEEPLNIKTISQVEKFYKRYHM